MNNVIRNCTSFNFEMTNYLVRQCNILMIIFFPKLSRFLTQSRERHYPIILSIIEIINSLSQIIKEDCIITPGKICKFPRNDRKLFTGKKKITITSL